MADNPMRPAARLCAALVVFVALVAAPLPTGAAAPTGPRDSLAEWIDGAPERFLYWAQRAAAPEIAEGLQQLDPGGRFILNLPWGDMTGDRADDVIAVDIDSGPGGLGLTGFSTTLRALDGRDGSSLWSREFDAQLVFPIEIRLGKKARPGALVVTYDYEDDATTFLALDHRGRRAYRHVFASTTQVDAGYVTGREEVISFALQDSLRGRASDVLIGVANVRRTPQVHPDVPSIVGVTTTQVIDGRTGKLVEHSEPELGVGRVPVPLRAPDLDGDGLDDHVMTYVLPATGSDEESELPTLPSLDGGELLRGRRGTDGTRLWTSPPLELDEKWDAPPLLTDVTLGDQTRDGHAEVLVSYDRHPYISPAFHFVYPSADQKGVWSLSGRNGNVLWHRAVSSARGVEDLDRDRRRDVLLVDDVSDGKRPGTRVVGASGLDARRVYSRFFPVRKRDDQTVESNLYVAGDLQPDRVTDFVLSQMLRREFENGMELAWVGEHLFSGRTGAGLGGVRNYSPVGASVDGRGDDLYRWASEGGAEIVDGRTRAPRLTVELDIPLTLPTDMDFLFPLAARLDRDRCADFVGTLMNSRSTFAVGIDGGSGRLLWAKRQQGIDLGGPVTQTRRVDRNRAC